MNYVNCSFTIRNLHEVIYQVEFGQEQDGKLGYDRLTQMSVDRLNHWINFSVEEQAKVSKQKILCELADLETLGRHLYKILFEDEKIRGAFATTYKQFQQRRQAQDKTLRFRLRLIFMKDAKTLAYLPWEFLLMPKGEKIPPPGDDFEGVFFAGENKELLLTRSVPQSALVEQLKAQAIPLRILIVICRPSRLPPLDEAEIDDVTRELNGLMQTGRVKVDVKEDLTWKQLKEELNPKAPSKPPHILHFISHGAAGKIAVIMDSDDPEYRTAAYDQKTQEHIGKPAKWITGRDMAGLLPDGDDRLRLVFLQVCKGAEPSTLGSFKSTASELVDADVPAVVAMQYSISNEDARLFARTFYRHIADGEEIDEAVNAGRIELAIIPPRQEHPRFGMPVVYLQSNKAIVVSPIFIPTDNGIEKCPYYDDCHQMIWTDRRSCICQLRRGQEFPREIAVVKVMAPVEFSDESLQTASQPTDEFD